MPILRQGMLSSLQQLAPAPAPAPVQQVNPATALAYAQPNPAPAPVMASQMPTLPQSTAMGMPSSSALQPALQRAQPLPPQQTTPLGPQPLPPQPQAAQPAPQPALQPAQPAQPPPAQNPLPVQPRQGMPAQNAWQTHTALPPPPPPPQPSLEQQALNGGGVDNKQQISNFMNALHQVNGAGNTNAMMQGANGAPQGPPPPMVGLVNPQATQQFNQGPPPPRPVGDIAQKIDNFGTYQNLMQNQPTSAGSPGNVGRQGSAGIDLSSISGAGNGTTQQGLYNGGTAGAAAGTSAMTQPQQVGQIGTKLQNAGAYGAMMSDETQKEQVSDATGKLNKFMGTIGAHQYKYKNPEMDGQGTYTTPMAQELQKTELGRQAVIETPRGLMVDYGRLGGVNLAAVSVVHREQQKLAAQVERLRGELRRRKG